MKNYLILIIPLFLFSCSEQEPDTIRIDLDTVYEDDSRGFLVFYPISGMGDSLYNDIKFPDLSKISDTAFGQIYFTGNNYAAIERGVLVLLGNHASQSPLIWVDYKNNLDFSESEELRFSEEFIDVSIPNTDKPQLEHTVRLHKPDSTKKLEVKEMLEQFLTKGAPYVDFFFDERRNIKVGDFVYKEDSLRIGLMDCNVNGLYNDLGKDRIVFGEYKGDLNGIDDASGAVLIDSVTYFWENSYGFEVKGIAANGTSIVIKPTTTKSDDRMTEGATIPNYTFELLSGKETTVRDYLDGQKYLYLSFWANWCAGCHQEVEDLKTIYADYSDKIKLIGLNYNEGKERANSFLEKHEIEWLNGISTPEMNEQLFIDGMPRNILIDPSGKIIEMNIHPSRLLERIENI